MVSRTRPPHHFISAPVTDLTPFTTPALAGAAAIKDSASTPRPSRALIGHLLHCASIIRLLLPAAPFKLSPRRRLSSTFRPFHTPPASSVIYTSATAGRRGRGARRK